MSGINDFIIKVANVNGSGSASANGILSKAIFRMGVPVASRNIFPSNIQGLPTWYVIRVNGEGYLGRSENLDFMIAMNPQTTAEDIGNMSPGGYLLYDSTRPINDVGRDDITLLPVPLTEISVDVFPETKTRLIMKNITYVGATAAFLDIDLEVVRGLLGEIYARKPKLVDLNYQAVQLAYDYVKEHFETPLPFRVQGLDRTEGQILLNGNSALAMGCLYAGATFSAWYPLTPSTSVAESFTSLCEKYRRDPETGKNNYCIVQAEDELAAVGMAIGAGWNGARAFTPTSGPGISLMSEFLGLAYYAEIPVVVFDVQRTGPSTGLPTRSQQGDLLACAFASHGDTKHILLFPSNPAECFDFAVRAFDLSERYQTPVIVLTDLDMGMNDWMIPKLTWDDSFRPDRGKVVTREELEESDAWYRYIDADGDGICRRSLPGTHPRGAYFTRGTGHDPFGRYTEKSSDYKENVDRLLRKFRGARTAVPPPELEQPDGATVGVVSLGSCDPSIREARDILAAEDLPIAYCRLKAFPFSEEVESFLEAYDTIIVIEANRDAQLKSLLTLETRVPKEKLTSLQFYSGHQPTAGFLVSGIRDIVAGREAPGAPVLEFAGTRQGGAS